MQCTEDLSPLNALTQLTWLSLSANLFSAWVVSLRLGADMMVSDFLRRFGIYPGLFTPAIRSSLSKTDGHSRMEGASQCEPCNS
jgi:hypothetical protein